MSTPLPPGWNSYVDHNGRVYYHDTKTGISQWEHPQPKPAVMFMPQPAVQQPAVQQQQNHMEQLRQLQEQQQQNHMEQLRQLQAQQQQLQEQQQLSAQKQEYDMLMQCMKFQQEMIRSFNPSQFI